MLLCGKMELHTQRHLVPGETVQNVLVRNYGREFPAFFSVFLVESLDTKAVINVSVSSTHENPSVAQRIAGKGPKRGRLKVLTCTQRNEQGCHGIRAPHRAPTTQTTWNPYPP